MGCEEILHYRASFLFTLKDDPRFLRFLPAVFPLRPFAERGFHAEDAAFCMRQLAIMYPGYSERGGLVSSMVLFSHTS